MHRNKFFLLIFLIVLTGMPSNITGSPKTKAGYPVFAQILGFFPAQPLAYMEKLGQVIQ